MDLSRLFDLESHGADTFVGIGPQYPWGGLYGGQIVAQALRAAAAPLTPISRCIRCAPISSVAATTPSRSGSRSTAFATAAASRPGGSSPARRSARSSTSRRRSSVPRRRWISRQSRWMPAFPGPSRWSRRRGRRRSTGDSCLRRGRSSVARAGAGRTLAWMKVNAPLGDDQLLHRCWLAYLSDDLPTDAVRAAHRDRATNGTVHRQPRPHDLVPSPGARRPMAPARLHLPRLRRRSRAGDRSRVRAPTACTSPPSLRRC